MPGAGVAVRRSHRAEIPALLELAAALPEWFTPRGLEHMAMDLRYQHRRAAVSDGRLAGFLSYFVNAGEGRIAWLAVASDRHRRGVGRALVAALEAELGVGGVQAVQVETLGDAVDYEPYDRTRAFYRALGYVDFRRDRTGDPECEELLTLRKPLPVLLHRYAAAHDTGVRTGDFGPLAALFAPGATVEFEGLPVAPLHGPAAIRAGYEARPPSDRLDLLAARLVGADRAEGVYGWRRDPGTPAGTLELHADGERIARLIIRVDCPRLGLGHGLGLGLGLGLGPGSGLP